MRSVTYSMSVSLDGYIVGPDGYIVGPDGDFDWTAPDEEVFRFVTDEIREVGVHLLGRRLYETMLYWETADQDPSLDDSMLEWAAIWKPLPKVVFSTTLSVVQGNARRRLGGPGCAASLDAPRGPPRCGRDCRPGSRPGRSRPRGNSARPRGRGGASDGPSGRRRPRSATRTDRRAWPAGASA